jgi:predicted regulator of Ras-like GTPase activity (Roadblock/LC7/MglB family)
MLKEKIQGFIEKISAVEGVSACALISRDGIMLGKSMQTEFNEPWFAAMNATLFASAESASTIIKAASPDMVTISSTDNTIVVMGAGEKLLIVAVTGRKTEPSPLVTALDAVAKEIGGSF